jgi:uncharacterized protein YcaQ
VVASVRVVRQRELQRAVLARQLLLARSRVSIPKALESVGGLQAQYAPAMYVGLWSRLEGFRRDDLTHALERRTVVQGTLMRSTIHLVSARDYWPFALAVRAGRRSWFTRLHKIGDAEMRAAARRVSKAFAAEGTLKARDANRIAGDAASPGLGLWLDLVRVPPSGTWQRRRADLLALAEDWIGPAPDLDAVTAITHLVRRYLTAFGPATIAEIAVWAGLGLSDAEAALSSLPTRRFVTDDDQPLFDLRAQPLPPADVPAPVRFLSTWEALLLVHARRALLIREEDRIRIFHNTTPQSKPTFLVDGQVAGTWRSSNGGVDIEPFRPLGRATMRAVEAEAALLAVFMG